MAEVEVMGLYINGPESYIKRVKPILGTPGTNPTGIVANAVGQLIITKIKDTKRKLSITRSTEQCNAGAQTEGNEDDAHPKGEHYFDTLVDDPKTKVNERLHKSTTKGTGKGVDTSVEFSPGIATCGSGGALEADTVLLHELVHGLRKMQGLENSEPLDGTSAHRYSDVEEWLAILVENVYQSVKGRTELRGAWDATTKLVSPYNTSDGFLGDATNRMLTRRYYSNWKQVFLDLSNIKANFNPFAAYKANPSKYAK